MINYFQTIVFVLLLSSCISKRQGLDDKLNLSYINQLKLSCRLNGNINDYNKLFEIKVLEFSHMDILYYSALMCNKYKYSKGCYDCYQIYSELGNFDTNRTADSTSILLAKFYLKKSKKLGYELNFFEDQLVTDKSEMYFLNQYNQSLNN